jgi:hypothetical protein
LFVLRAATVPRSTEILPLGFDWVTFLLKFFVKIFFPKKIFFGWARARAPQGRAHHFNTVLNGGTENVEWRYIIYIPTGADQPRPSPNERHAPGATLYGGRGEG